MKAGNFLYQGDTLDILGYVHDHVRVSVEGQKPLRPRT
jgi:hypothetical protein